ncbi:Sua5/YciO/YrdC/YwlC family tRNA threonylcarbamoyl adenosine modification protein [Cryptococcus depauperatus]
MAGSFLRSISQLQTRFAKMSAQNTPILQCQDWTSISIKPSGRLSHPLDSPTFSIPPTIQAHLERASECLHSGQTVAVPTETVYGLAASSLDPNACKKIYQIKKRPSDNPLIIHVSSLDMLRRILPSSYNFSPLYLALITSFWPGPLSLLFPSANPQPLPAPQTNAIRMPSHPLALALIALSDLPLSAPSANSSGRPSPTQAQHVYHDLNGAPGLSCILDGGKCGVGVESTVVDGLEWKKGGGGKVDILRPGGLGIEDIKRIVNAVDGKEGKTEILVHGEPWRETTQSSFPQDSTTGSAAQAERHKREKLDLPPSTPGMKYRHYSPKVPVYLLKPSNVFPPPSSLSLSTPTSPLRRHKQRLGILHFENSPLSRHLSSCPNMEIIPISLGNTAISAAQRLFAGMLALETVHNPHDPSTRDAVDAIVIEGCTDQGLGLAVMERIEKAVGGGGVVGDVSEGEEQSCGNENQFWVNVDDV